MSTAIISELKNITCVLHVMSLLTTILTRLSIFLELFVTRSVNYYYVLLIVFGIKTTQCGRFLSNQNKLVQGLESLGVEVTVREYKPIVELIEQENNFLDYSKKISPNIMLTKFYLFFMLSFVHNKYVYYIHHLQNSNIPHSHSNLSIKYFNKIKKPDSM